MGNIIDMVNEVYSQCTFRIATGVLNDCIMDAVTFSEPPTDKGRRLKIYYGTQVSIKPPTFVLLSMMRSSCIILISDIWKTILERVLDFRNTYQVHCKAKNQLEEGAQ